eukprot:3064677-Amphidinium_carterae.1
MTVLGVSNINTMFCRCDRLRTMAHQVYENLTESESENYELYVEETVTFCQHLVCLLSCPHSMCNGPS